MGFKKIIKPKREKIILALFLLLLLYLFGKLFAFDAGAVIFIVLGFPFSLLFGIWNVVSHNLFGPINIYENPATIILTIIGLLFWFLTILNILFNIYLLSSLYLEKVWSSKRKIFFILINFIILLFILPAVTYGCASICLEISGPLEGRCATHCGISVIPFAGLYLLDGLVTGSWSFYYDYSYITFGSLIILTSIATYLLYLFNKRIQKRRKAA